MPACLVSPDNILYILEGSPSDGRDWQLLRNQRPDLPPVKNLNQMIGETDGPHDGRGKADNWQRLSDIRWVKHDDMFIPFVGTASNALKTFNAVLQTSYLLDATFRKLYSGERRLAGWKKSLMPPHEVYGLQSGSSLLGLRDRPDGDVVAAMNAAVNCDDGGAQHLAFGSSSESRSDASVGRTQVHIATHQPREAQPPPACETPNEFEKNAPKSRENSAQLSSCRCAGGRIDIGVRASLQRLSRAGPGAYRDAPTTGGPASTCMRNPD